jgi:hypothetical protein
VNVESYAQGVLVRAHIDAKALACEVHADAGDVSRFLADVEACGLNVGPTRYAEDGSVIFLARRSA